MISFKRNNADFKTRRPEPNAGRVKYHDTVLMTCTKQGERRYQMWVTPQEADRKRKLYELAGWTVDLRDTTL